MDQFFDNLSRRLATASSRRDALRISFTALFGGIASACVNPAAGGCSGTQTSCAGGCIPSGSVCCSNGSYCASGTSCCNNNTQCCPNCGSGPCGSGQVCCNGGCIPSGSVCCSNGSYCNAGTSCCNNDTQCCSGGGSNNCLCGVGNTYNYLTGVCCPNGTPYFYPGTHGITGPGCYASCPYIGDCGTTYQKC